MYRARASNINSCAGLLLADPHFQIPVLLLSEQTLLPGLFDVDGTS